MFKHFPFGPCVNNVSSDGEHLGWRAGTSDIFLTGDHPRTISSKCRSSKSSLKKETILKYFPISSYVKTMLTEGGHFG